MKGMVTKDNLEILTLEHYLQLKSGGFEFEGQSYLFWEFVRILKETNPKYFLLENVIMEEKWANIITKEISKIQTLNSFVCPCCGTTDCLEIID